MTRDFATGLDVAKFDYYAGSLDEPVCGDLVVSQLAGRLDAVPTPGPASRGYARCALLRRGDERVAAVRWGGRHAVPHVEASGASSGAVSDIMLLIGLSARDAARIVVRCRRPLPIVRYIRTP